MVWTVPGHSSAECPVSRITPKSREMLEMYAMHVKYAAQGMPLFGNDLSRWPAWAVDLIAVLDAEAAAVEQYRSPVPRPQPPDAE